MDGEEQQEQPAAMEAQMEMEGEVPAAEGEGGSPGGEEVPQPMPEE